LGFGNGLFVLKSDQMFAIFSAHRVYEGVDTFNLSKLAHELFQLVCLTLKINVANAYSSHLFAEFTITME
jgi:hypothetical protein